MCYIRDFFGCISGFEFYVLCSVICYEVDEYGIGFGDNGCWYGVIIVFCYYFFCGSLFVKCCYRIKGIGFVVFYVKLCIC